MSTIQLSAEVITYEKFQAYGQQIMATGDGKPYDAADAQLELSSGIPRFYIMRLQQRGRQFDRITRHQRCTQCLGSLAGKDWYLAVAPPSPGSAPNLDQLMAFKIPGTCFVKLHVGTWHAGPYFDEPFIDFYNLELSDTNITDHETYAIATSVGITYEIV
ncbi:MAG: ureidoglycolate lyase [Cyanobacteria bacterium P01_H01_bin.121]